MSVPILILMAVLIWAVLALPLAMLVGRLSRGNEKEAFGSRARPRGELVKH